MNIGRARGLLIGLTLHVAVVFAQQVPGTAPTRDDTQRVRPSPAGEITPRQTSPDTPPPSPASRPSPVPEPRTPTTRAAKPSEPEAVPAPLTSSAPATLPAPDTAPAPSPPVAQDTDVTEQRIQGHKTPDAGDTPALAPVTPPTWTGPGGSLIDRLPPPPQAVGPGPAELTAEPDQILILTPDMLSAQQLEEALNREGARLRTRRALDHLGGVMSVFRLPAHADLAQTLTNWQTAYPDYLIDRNTRYTLQSADRHQYAQHLIVWQAAPTCPPARAIGLIDTPVDITHPALQGADLTQRLFVTRQPADAEHGTAIVSLLVAQPEQGLPGGLLPHARIFSAAAFRRRDQQTETLTEWLLDALNWLLAQQVGVINLSLGGRHNRVLEVALQRVLEKGVVLVAAAGNQGPQAPPVYPAAQPGVIAVTAVDARQRVYREANQGEHISLAAPGVDVWSATPNQPPRYRSGTSFAAPFVTAQAALLPPQWSPAEVRTAMANNARDLGAPGKDPVYGWGLLQWSIPCP